jgi:hypothetical protein
MKLWACLFPYIMPLVVWGGLLQYPVLLYMLVNGYVSTCFVSFCCCYLLCANKSKLVGILRVPVSDSPLFIMDGESITPGPSIHLLHPHALFTEGVNYYAMSHLCEKGCVILIDKYLYYASPLGMLFIVMLGCKDVAPLVHGRIKELLGRGTNLIVIPGGFLEAADFSRHHETVYLHMYPYWMRMAREYPSYRLYSTFGYNLAGRFFQQSSYMKETRLRLARRGLIGVCPMGIACTSLDKPIFMYTQRIHPDIDTLLSIKLSFRRIIDAHDAKQLGSRIKYRIITEA